MLILCAKLLQLCDPTPCSDCQCYPAKHCDTVSSSLSWRDSVQCHAVRRPGPLVSRPGLRKCHVSARHYLHFIAHVIPTHFEFSFCESTESQEQGLVFHLALLTNASTLRSRLWTQPRKPNVFPSSLHPLRPHIFHLKWSDRSLNTGRLLGFLNVINF